MLNRFGFAARDDMDMMLNSFNEENRESIVSTAINFYTVWFSIFEGIFFYTSFLKWTLVIYQNM